jgi:hypothetical protein
MHWLCPSSPKGLLKRRACVADLCAVAAAATASSTTSMSLVMAAATGLRKTFLVMRATATLDKQAGTRYLSAEGA